MRSTLRPSAKAWNWSARISRPPATTGPVVAAPRSLLAAPDDGLHARQHLLGVAGLGDPVVGAHPQPAHALGDRRAAGADHHAQAGHRLGELLEEVPGVGAEQREIHHEGVDAHGHEFLDPRSGLEPAVLPAHALQAVHEDAHEA